MQLQGEYFQRRHPKYKYMINKFITSNQIWDTIGYIIGWTPIFICTKEQGHPIIDQDCMSIFLFVLFLASCGEKCRQRLGHLWKHGDRQVSAKRLVLGQKLILHSVSIYWNQTRICIYLCARLIRKTIN